MSEQDKIAFVTNDRWLRENGKLDPTDRAVLQEAAQGGEVVIISLRQALEQMKAEEPTKFQAFHREREKAVGKALTFDDLVRLGEMADEKKTAYDSYIGLIMTKEQAAQIRSWRVNGHYTWRAVASAAFWMATAGAWLGWRLWQPPSNQIMGMSLCERAAEFFNENYREPPWN